MLLTLSAQMSVAEDLPYSAIEGTILVNGKNAEDILILLSPQQRVTYTNENGFFKFKNVKPGTYKITVKVAGEVAQEKELIHTNTTSTINFAFSANTKSLAEVKVQAKRVLMKVL